MQRADNPGTPSGQSSHRDPSASYDVLIVGGGIMGLWAALKAARRGLKTMLVDAGSPGHGASGGLLGALMPHMPDRWSPKKQFQFEALIDLETEIKTLEAETGLSAGYRRCGRIIPLPKPHLRDIALRHERDAAVNWGLAERQFHWHVLDRPPVSGWIDAAAGDSGFVYDTLAGRVSPRGLTGMLVARLGTTDGITVRSGARVDTIDPVAGKAVFSTGETVSFGHCIVAAGVGAFGLIEGLGGMFDKPLGQPVKGQAARLKADVDPSLPVIFRDGLYVVAHDGGHVAVGSTSEDRFSDPFATDGLLDDLIAAARRIAPVLETAVVVERWAGLRPKAIGRDPMVGPHPVHRRIVALGGGFKVSFGLAHRLADAALDAVCGTSTIALPPGFLLDAHMDAASRKA